MSDLLGRVLANHMREVVEQRERLLERMLTDPRGWGVLEHEHFDLDAMQVTMIAELSPLVPFGAIHTHNVDRRDCGICKEVAERERWVDSGQ